MGDGGWRTGDGSVLDDDGYDDDDRSTRGEKGRRNGYWPPAGMLGGR
jgi:hypothetical protein